MCVLLIILNAKIRLFVVCQSIYPPSYTLKMKKNSNHSNFLSHSHQIRGINAYLCTNFLDEKYIKNIFYD